MSKELDLADIQGNVIRAYGRFGYPQARYFFLNIQNAAAGRQFINALFPHVTSAIRWKSPVPGQDYPGEERIDRPDVTLNIGFSYAGLEALELPTRTLKAMPSEFIDGMKKRSYILSDVGINGHNNWDDIWKNNHGTNRVHIWRSMNALVDFEQLQDGKFKMKGDLAARTKWLEKLIAQFTYKDEDGKTRPGIKILSGHGKEGTSFQQAAALIKNRDGRDEISAEEHFGFRDGIGDPVFEGQFTKTVEQTRVKGRGKIMPNGSWAPLETGEFLLGHPDESQELPVDFLPPEISRNGTFMAYRKLHENVAGFETYIATTAKVFARVMGMDEAEAAETLKAKMIGRWSDGTPLVKADTEARRKQFREAYERDLKLAKDGYQAAMLAKDEEKAAIYGAQISEIKQRETDFKYADDFGGIKCPYASHLRRGNARDMLDPQVALGPDASGKVPQAGNGSALNKRRRILRRGLPYGSAKKGAKKSDDDQGIIFMAVCASLFRQFEFLQQQWMQYGLDFQAGNDTCPVIGHRDENFPTKFVIPSDPQGDKPPFICSDIPPLVTTKGGEYFFIPGMTALRMIAMGIVDPT